MNTYTTLAKEGTATLVERRSEFIGYAKPVNTEEEAAAFVMSIKKKHADARHNVFAYVLLGGALKRYSDDGEPQGSAGMPVLDVICKNGLDGAAVVVTRYFGGILLGTGGLVRAYSSAASAAVADAGIITYEEVVVLKMKCSYNDHARVQNEFARYGIEIEDTEFTSDVTLTMTSPTVTVENFKVRMRDLTAGRSIPTEIGRKLAPPRKVL
ncbi:MAG: YigZ family protein [Clostridia bacterium]|nr:YigZ family protein [Clostridia bacterium]